MKKKKEKRKKIRARHPRINETAGSDDTEDKHGMEPGLYSICICKLDWVANVVIEDIGAGAGLFAGVAVRRRGVGLSPCNSYGN